MRWGSMLLAGAVLAGCENSSKLDVIVSPEPTDSVAADSTPVSVLIPGSLHPETQRLGAPTFTQYDPATGDGPLLPASRAVLVDCVVLGTDALQTPWFHMVSPAQFAGYFAMAGTFESGVPVDPAIPLCP